MYKEGLQIKEARERNIADSPRKYNSESYQKGETLPEDHLVYRVKVVSAFLRAGMPKIQAFRELLEENASLPPYKETTHVPRNNSNEVRNRLTSIFVYVIACLGGKIGINTTSIVWQNCTIEAKPSAICYSHCNTSGICPKFYDQPCYHRLIPYSRTPAYLQVQEHAASVARWVGIN